MQATSSPLPGDDSPERTNAQRAFPERQPRTVPSIEPVQVGGVLGLQLGGVRGKGGGIGEPCGGGGIEGAGSRGQLGRLVPQRGQRAPWVLCWERNRRGHGCVRVARVGRAEDAQHTDPAGSPSSPCTPTPRREMKAAPRSDVALRILLFLPPLGSGNAPQPSLFACG